MIRSTVLLTAMVFATITTNLRGESDHRVLMFGGDESCARWIEQSQNPAFAGYRKNWIYGFFSGANIFGSHGEVGHTTDAEGIVGEITKLCREEPSTPLNSATAQVYKKLQDRNR